MIDKLRRRVAPVLLSLVLVIGCMGIRPPKAQAVFPAVMQLYSLAASFFASVGLSWGVNSMDTTGFGDSVGRLLQDYLDTEFAGQTPLEWAGDFAAVATPQGKLQIPAMLARKLAQFANWTIGKYAITAGGGAVDITGSGDMAVTVVNGITHIGGIPIFSSFSVSSDPSFCFISDGSTEPYGTKFIPFPSFPETYIKYKSRGCVLLYTEANSSGIYGVSSLGFKFYWNEDSSSVELRIGFCDFDRWSFKYDESTTNPKLIAKLTSLYLSGATPGTVTIGGNPAIPADDVIPDIGGWEVDVGAAPGVTTDDLLQQILDQIIAGNLVAAGSVVTDVAQPEQPELSWTDTLWGWLTGIKDAIIGLPARIGEAIKALFIPAEGFFDTALQELQATFEGRMGLLTYPISILYTFLNRVLTIQEQDPILRWSAVSWMGTVIIQAGEYNLNDAIQAPAAKAAHDVYLLVMDAVMICGFLSLCWKKYNSIIHQ